MNRLNSAKMNRLNFGYLAELAEFKKKFSRNFPKNSRFKSANLAELAEFKSANLAELAEFKSAI